MKQEVTPDRTKIRAEIAILEAAIPKLLAEQKNIERRISVNVKEIERLYKIYYSQGGE